MTRQRQRPASAQTSTQANITQPGVLFHYANWIGLTASNQWGFDVVNLNGDYYESLVKNQDFNQLMQCFALVLTEGLHLPIGRIHGGRAAATTQIGSAAATSGGGTARQRSTGTRGGTAASRRAVPVAGQTVGASSSA
jgi:hypothetical protein